MLIPSRLRRRPGIALTLHTDRPDDAIPLAMTQLSLCHLDLSGPTASLSLLGQF